METIDDLDIPDELKHNVLSQYHVVCSVTGKNIPLSDLKYWNVKLQKAYIGPEVIDICEFYPHLANDDLETTKSTN